MEKHLESRWPQVGAVILNWNGWKHTIDLLDSIARVKYQPFTVVIVDNASADESLAKIEGWFGERGVDHRILDYRAGGVVVSADFPAEHGYHGRQYVLIRSSENLGFCAGNNLGLQWAFSAGAEFALVLNNDTLVEPGFLGPMVEAASTDPAVGLVGGVITYCSAPETVWWAGGKFDRFLNSNRLHDGGRFQDIRASTPFETDWVSGCMMLIPSRIFDEIGGFDEDFFIWSEEWDYSIRVARAGYKLVVAPGARICHKVGRSLGVMTPLNYYYGIRNGLVLQKKHLPPRLWYPYFTYYLANRALRFTQLAMQGRSDLARAGLEAVADMIRGRRGRWRRQA